MIKLTGNSEIRPLLKIFLQSKLDSTSENTFWKQRQMYKEKE